MLFKTEKSIKNIKERISFIYDCSLLLHLFFLMLTLTGGVCLETSAMQLLAIYQSLFKQASFNYQHGFGELVWHHG